jgi:hypothetical protein
MSENSVVIVFENLMQGTSTVGEYAPVAAKAKPFISANAHGVLREVESFDAVRSIAATSAEKTLKMLQAS